MGKETEGVRIGEILVGLGVLSAEQVEAIVAEQKKVGRPFGDLAERMFDVAPSAVEQAWVDQYTAFGTEADLEQQEIDTQVLRVLNRRQAWQFRMLPLRRENNELIAATDKENLRRACGFAWNTLDEPIYFLIARRPQLEEFLMDHYPWPGILDLPAAG